MHNVDPTTESMIRSVLAYAENRLRLDPVPLDQGSRDPAELDAALAGLPGPGPHTPDQVLGVYASAMAPAVISADSPRFLGFIPAALIVSFFLLSGFLLFYNFGSYLVQSRLRAIGDQARFLAQSTVLEIQRGAGRDALDRA